jgi:hypothetical protein
MKRWSGYWSSSLTHVEANMTRNRLAILVVICLAFLVTTPVLAAKDYRADRFDVGLDIQKDGSLIVTETIQFRFEGGPFTYVFREISKTETDGITILSASMDGVQFQPGTGPGQLEITEGDPVKVTWRFTPTSDSSHEFVLRYQARGSGGPSRKPTNTPLAAQPFPSPTRRVYDPWQRQALTRLLNRRRSIMATA